MALEFDRVARGCIQFQTGLNSNAFGSTRFPVIERDGARIAIAELRVETILKFDQSRRAATAANVGLAVQPGADVAEEQSLRARPSARNAAWKAGHLRVLAVDTVVHLLGGPAVLL
jgi:uncharacterized phage protein gp47/JayE